MGARPPRPFLAPPAGGSAGGAGGGPYSAAIRKTWPVFSSMVIVLARGIVFTFSSSEKLVGPFDLTIVSVPSPPFEL